jgi:hypothetical protein
MLIPQPAEWKFIADLQTPLHQPRIIQSREASSGEIDLRQGVALFFDFPDPDQRLATAYADFERFLACGNIAIGKGYRVCLRQTPGMEPDSYSLEATLEQCTLTATGTEGIRRGLVYLEDEILRAGGAFLSCQATTRRPVIKTRISRCFFGPIKRPPMNRDELADDVNYYPEEYLNRLAHEGVNGLWLSVTFRDLCPSKYFPNHGQDREKRLAKLRQTVVQCARYGIKIYVFCIEPVGFGDVPEYTLPLSELEQVPFFAGHREGAFVYFCTSTPEGQEYLYDCTQYLFSQVPGLGGLIDINLGERPTHCYSNTHNFGRSNCPRCSKRQPWEVFADTTAALARGMQDANPQAEMISWLYVPYLWNDSGSDNERKMDFIRDIAAHVPENVMLQYNFESNGKAMQLGKERVLPDYWLAWPGPSGIFADCADNATGAGTRISAKIQVGCSHEVATVPFVPVPGNLYKKYAAMHRLGVSAAMQCWYFGNYPGLMNKAAGELSFAPLPETEEEFLHKLALTEWGEHAAIVAKAWKLFSESYSHFPYNGAFTWYGPLHNSIVWPLHLVPVDQPIAPSWKFTFPAESGDRVGECLIADHTLEEALALLDKMAEIWENGVSLLRDIEPDYKHNAARKLDIALSKALGLQISSARNVFHFYALREKLPHLPQAQQKATLVGMRRLVEAEIVNSGEIKRLCEQDARLGFHSEAEGYKYFPALLAHRAERLQSLLSDDFPAVELGVNAGKKLFPSYTGQEPEGKVYACGKNPAAGKWESLGRCGEWRVSHFDGNLRFEIRARFSGKDESEHIEIALEPRRLWPSRIFVIKPNGEKSVINRGFIPVAPEWEAEISRDGVDHKPTIVIPLASIPVTPTTDRLRVNLSVVCGKEDDSWVEKHPLEPRLIFGKDNPTDYGWLLLTE